MSRKRRKMVNLAIEETSGVDHPAHLSEGWVVMKNASKEGVFDALSGIEVSQMSEQATEVGEVIELQDALLAAEARVDELEKAMYGADDEEENAKKKKRKMRNGDMTDEELEKLEMEEEEEKKKKKAKKEDEEEMMKAVPQPVRKMIEDLRKEAADAVTELRKERTAKADADAIALVKSWQSLSLDADKVGPLLRKLNDVDTELAKSVKDVLSAVNGQAESANIFAEIGNSNASTATSAYERLSGMAKAAVEAGTAATFEQAFVDAASANPDLYNSHLAEGR